MKKLSRKERLLFFAPVLLLALPIAHRVQKELNRDAMDKAMRKLGGPNALDCGIRECGDDKVGAVSECVLTARKNRKPFFFRVTYGFIYSQGFVMTPEGQLYMLGYGRRKWGLARIIHQDVAQA